MSPAIKKSLLELARVIVLAAIGWGVAYVTALPESQTTVIVLFVLKAVDKYVHENENLPVKGLLPF